VLRCHGQGLTACATTASAARVGRRLPQPPCLTCVQDSAASGALSPQEQRCAVPCLQPLRLSTYRRLPSTRTANHRSQRRRSHATLSWLWPGFRRTRKNAQQHAPVAVLSPCQAGLQLIMTASACKLACCHEQQACDGNADSNQQQGYTCSSEHDGSALAGRSRWLVVPPPRQDSVHGLLLKWH